MSALQSNLRLECTGAKWKDNAATVDAYLLRKISEVKMASDFLF